MTLYSLCRHSLENLPQNLANFTMFLFYIPNECHWMYTISNPDKATKPALFAKVFPISAITNSAVKALAISRTLVLVYWPWAED